MTWAGDLEGMRGTQLDAFGVATTFQPSAGDPVSVRGIFQRDYVDVHEGEAGISSTGPAVWYRRSDLAVDPAVGASVVHSGTTYRVIQVKPDGQGGVTLRLHVA